MSAMQVPGFIIGPITVLLPLLLYAYHVRRYPRDFRPVRPEHGISLSYGGRIGVRRILGYICGAIAYAGLFLHLFLYTYYATNRPRYPEPGRTIPLNEHGTVVYLTGEENALVWWPFDSMFLFGGLGGIFFLSASKHPRAS
jgi:hypothetical protein